jgi:hypothetical protein
MSLTTGQLQAFKTWMDKQADGVKDTALKMVGAGASNATEKVFNAANWALLAAPFIAGGLGGAVASKVTSPSSDSIENLQRQAIDAEIERSLDEMERRRVLAEYNSKLRKLKGDDNGKKEIRI